MSVRNRFGRIGAFILALVMIFSVLPISSFAESAKVPAESLQLKDGETVAISKDMQPSQIKKALFDSLVLNPEGASYLDYDWEVYGWAQSEYGPAFQRNKWVSFIEGDSWIETILLSDHHFNIKPVKDSSDSDFRIRVKGSETEVTIHKISTASVAYNYNVLEGTILVDGKKVNGNIGSVSPAKDIEFKVVPENGYEIAKVTLNNKELEGKNGVYSFSPVASSNIEVSFKQVGNFVPVTINAGEGVTVKMNGNEVKNSVNVVPGSNYTFEFIPNEKTSVLSVFNNDVDATKDVKFQNYVGTITLSFNDAAKLTVNSIAVDKQFALTDKRVSSLAFQENGDWDWGMIRQNLIDTLIAKDHSINVQFTPKNFTFEQYAKYFTVGNVPGVSSAWVPLEGQDSGPLLGSWYYAISVGNNHLRFKFNGNSQFRPTDFVELDVQIVDSLKSNIVLKDNYNKDFELKYDANGEFDYELLRREIFDAVVDTDKSTEHVTYKNAKITYQLLNGLGIDDQILSGLYYDFEQGWIAADAAGTYRYLYKGGNFNFKITIPKIGVNNGTEVVVNLNVKLKDRLASSVVLKSGSTTYSSNTADFKTALFNLIDFDASNLPENVTPDNFNFEYYAPNYTAGDILGVEKRWVPLEGMKHPTLAGSYFKPMAVGSQTVRVYFRGNEGYVPSTSNTATFTVEGADLKTTLTRDYKFVDQKITKDLVATESSVPADFEHYYIMVDANNPTATIYIDSSLGLKMTDFTANIPFNDILLQIFGIGSILSADEIYQRRGLSRDEMNTLLNDGRFKWYMQAYQGIDENAVNEIIEVFNRLPETVTHFMFQMGQPTRAGEYYFMAITAKQNFKTAVATNDNFYVKFHSKGVRLHFMQNISEVSMFNVGSFDYSAVVTKNGIPIKSDHVRYLYLGISLTDGILISTKNPPKSAGLYYQLAYTGLGGRYAFPISRLFLIAL